MGETEEAPASYRINTDDEQVRLEQERLLTLARVIDPATRATLAGLGVKLLSERPWGDTLVADGALTIAPLAHASGALAGLVCTLALLAWRHTRRP